MGLRRAARTLWRSGGWSCGDGLRLLRAARAAASARGGPQLAVAPFACTPQAADRLCRSNRTGCYTGCCPPSQTAATAGCGPILSLIVNEASNSIIEVTVFEAPAARALRRGSRGGGVRRRATGRDGVQRSSWQKRARCGCFSIFVFISEYSLRVAALYEPRGPQPPHAEARNFAVAPQAATTALRYN